MCKKTLGSLHPSLAIVTDFTTTTISTAPDANDQAESSAKPRPLKQISQNGIYALDLDYKPITAYVQKLDGILRTDPAPHCTICSSGIESATAAILVCPIDSCHMTSHLKCLANHFLGQGPKGDLILPIQGQCPQCQSQLQWSELVRELSLRTRGPGLVQKLLKPKTRRGKGATTDVYDDEDDDDPEDEEDELVYQEHDDNGDAIGLPGPNDDSDHSDSSLDVPLSVKVNHRSQTDRVGKSPAKVIATMIPNSEWDDIENVLD